jgi:hypothetical protein
MWVALVGLIRLASSYGFSAELLGKQRPIFWSKIFR